MHRAPGPVEENEQRGSRTKLKAHRSVKNVSVATSWNLQILSACRLLLRAKALLMMTTRHFHILGLLLAKQCSAAYIHFLMA